MRSKLIKPLKKAVHDTAARSPRSHHHIGKSEDEPEHIGTFLRTHQGDPAITVRFLFHQISTIDIDITELFVQT